MNKFLYLFLLSFFISPLYGNAQCTPDPTLDARGAYPAVLPVGCAGIAYEQTITVVAPIDTLVSGFIVPIDSMKIGVAGNLPFSFTAECGTFNCMAYPGGLAGPARECIRLAGFPATSIPSDTVFIPVTYYVTLFGFPTPLEDQVYVLLETIEADTSVSVVGRTLISQASSASYQWLDCNDGMNPILGETGPSYSPTSTGDYAVEVTQNGCTGTSSCHAISFLSVTELLSGKNVSVYPNPTNGDLQIDLQNVDRSVYIRVFNTIGALVYEQTSKGGIIELLQLDFPSGVYTLELSTKNSNSIRRSVVLQ